MITPLSYLSLPFSPFPAAIGQNIIASHIWLSFVLPVSEKATTKDSYGVLRRTEKIGEIRLRSGVRVITFRRLSASALLEAFSWFYFR